MNKINKNNNFNFFEFIKIFEEKKLANYRMDQFIDFYFSKNIKDFLNWDNLQTWPKKLREDFSEKIILNNIKNYKIYNSKNKRSYKALLEFNDKNAVETVLITYEKYNTLCLSSQIGCALNCQFCATGASGFTRNLTVNEILEQYQLWLININNKKLNLKNDNIKNIVFMGMGEPFMNWENVKNAIYLLNNYYKIGFRHITVSTAGIVKGLKKFADENWQVNLAISLHASFNRTRNILMPINESNDLKKLWKFIEYYFSKNNRKIFLEYILIDEINDSLEEIEYLIKKIKITNQKLLHLNLILYNKVENKPWERTKKPQLKKIEFLLRNNKIHYTIRDSLGNEITGACGQLKSKKYA